MEYIFIGLLFVYCFFKIEKIEEKLRKVSTTEEGFAYEIANVRDEQYRLENRAEDIEVKLGIKEKKEYD